MGSLNEKIAGKNTLCTDYRAEFVAACLIENGFDPDEIRIIREGISKGGKNIDKIVWENSLDRFSRYLSIYTRKRDLYESLPEGIFHKRMDLNDKRDKDTVVEYIRHERQVAMSASFFFRPFEMSIDRLLVEVNLYEMRLEKRDKHDDFVGLFEPVWQELQDMPLDKSLFAVSLLSQAYRLTKPEQIAEILSVFLDCDVDIDVSYKQLTLPTDQCDWKLGESRLGVSTVIGGGVTDCFPVMNVRIDSLPPKYKDLMFENTPAYNNFIDILDLFVPADTEVNININVAKEGIVFLLTDDETAPLLGYSTILS
ncbi:MAG: type VI secretion system baseplate subunit TssG [Paludibacteraceae bacterium]|nr:type VI secretion system baseplate subunit TssG [Paludibacteraceae bacterium]